MTGCPLFLCLQLQGILYFHASSYSDINNYFTRNHDLLLRWFHPPPRQITYSRQANPHVLSPWRSLSFFRFQASWLSYILNCLMGL